MNSNPVQIAALQSVKKAIAPIKKLSTQVHDRLLVRAKEGFFAGHQSATSIRALADELLNDLLPKGEEDEDS